jgi:adenylate cyclase
LVGLGETDRGLEWAERARSLEPDDPMVLYNVACILSLAGRVEPAVAMVEEAVHAGLQQIGWLRHDSNLDPLRKHPRFVSVMQWLEERERTASP